MKLTGRTILITGGSAGIGLAFALKFLELGNEVIVTGRRQAVLDEAKSRHPKLHTIQSDIANPEQIAALAAQVKAAMLQHPGVSTSHTKQPPSLSLITSCTLKG